jgi:hypothetical protein
VIALVVEEPEFVFHSVPMKMKTHLRGWITSMAGVAFLLIAGLLLLRSHAFHDQPVASGAESVQPPESNSATPNDSHPPGNSAEPPSRDSAIKSADDAESGISSSKLSSASSGESFAANDGIPRYADPKDWVKTALPCWGLRGTAPKDFVVAADQRVLTSGKSSASIEAVGLTSGWGTLYQFANAQDLRGKRVEFSADIRTAAAALRASIFVRADDARGNAVALDNMWFNYSGDVKGPAMLNRSLSGDNEWTTERVVLDIPLEATAVSYGAILEGAGKVWIDNAHLEIVGNDTPVTAIVRPATMLQQSAFPLTGQPPSPRNLDFERGSFNGKCD